MVFLVSRVGLRAFVVEVKQNDSLLCLMGRALDCAVSTFLHNKLLIEIHWPAGQS